MTIQVSHGPDTVIVTHSINQALAAIRDLIQSNPDPLPPVEVDFWKDGVIDDSRGFVPVMSELNNIQAFMLSYLSNAMRPAITY